MPVGDYFPFFGGFRITAKQVAEPRVTTEYPKEKRPKPPRLHGRHVLNRYEDGEEKEESNRFEQKVAKQREGDWGGPG